MDDLKEIRWKQRFKNFEKSYKLLEKYSQKEICNELEIAGLIQFFEMTFELAWKVQKDYLESKGIIVQSPKEAIKQAFQMGLLNDGYVWIDALSNRNLTVHTYNGDLADKLVITIVEVYFPEIEKLYNKLLLEV